MKKSLVSMSLMLCILLVFSSCSEKIAGTWKLTPVKTEEVPGGRPKFISGPLFMTWETSEDATLGFFKVSGIASMVTSMGSGKVAQQLKDITFQKDGNVIATYALPSTDPGKEIEWKKSEPGIVTYKVVDDKIMLTPNVDDLISRIPADSLKTNATLQSAVELLKKGIPVNYTLENNTAKLFIDKAFIESVFPLILAGLEHVDPTTLGKTGSFIKGMLQGVPAILQKTTKMEIGFNLVK